MNATDRVWRTLGALRRRLTRGRAHRRRLEGIDIRVAVTGSRGKSTLVRWLHEALTDRGYDTYSKTTGEEPTSRYNDATHRIERTGRVTLYENEREIREYDPADALVVENHGIREYTTRLVNTRYVDPQVVALTNVRPDHLDTLGTDHREIARSLVRSVPSGAHVVTGEENDALVAYMEREFERRDVALTRAAVPDPGTGPPGAELVAVADAVLAALEVTPLSDAERARFRSRMAVDWRRLPGGRVYCAAAANDVETTERIRRALLGDALEPVRPLVYFRRDRPGRTASYLEYLDSLAERGLASGVHVVGDHRRAAARRLAARVVTHDPRTESADTVLDAALEAGDPVMVMANAVPEFVGDLRAAIRRRETVEPEPIVPAAE